MLLNWFFTGICSVWIIKTLPIIYQHHHIMPQDKDIQLFLIKYTIFLSFSKGFFKKSRLPGEHSCSKNIQQFIMHGFSLTVGLNCLKSFWKWKQATIRKYFSTCKGWFTKKLGKRKTNKIFFFNLKNSGQKNNN